jgi:UDP-N-acetylglucosamine 3-dehydrogenase
MSQYQAGIIGLGYIGAADQISGDALGQNVSDLDGTHVVAYENHARIDIVGGSSRDQGRRERFAARTAAQTYALWGDLVAKQSLDIVSVATYAPYHAEIVVACAEAGIRAIYCEKPIATRLDDAVRMVAACKQAGALLVLNHQRRFNANHRKLRDAVAAGELGELTSANVQWGSGRLGNVGTHFLDALMMITGRKVTRVSGRLDLAARPDCRGDEFADPGASGLLLMEGNLPVTLDAPDYGATPGSITLNGTLGRAQLQTDVTIEKWDGAAESWPAPARSPSGMDVAVSEMVQHLDGDAAFPYDADAARLTFEAIVGLHASHHREGQFVDLPLVGADRTHQVNSG